MTGIEVDRKSQNPVGKLLERTRESAMKGVRTLIAAPSAGRMETMSQLLRTGGLSVEEFPDWQTFLDADSALGIAAAAPFSIIRKSLFSRKRSFMLPVPAAIVCAA